jgi:hypothetical protein
MGSQPSGRSIQALLGPKGWSRTAHESSAIPGPLRTTLTRALSYVAIKLAGNRHAAHPVNAILNYAYAVLQRWIQIDAVAEGNDPTIGIMHEKRAGSSAFIFDLMEPERPMIDQKVLEFVKSHVFDPADFLIRTDGVCRLNPLRPIGHFVPRGVALFTGSPGLPLLRG